MWMAEVLQHRLVPIKRNIVAAIGTQRHVVQPEATLPYDLPRFEQEALRQWALPKWDLVFFTRYSERSGGYGGDTYAVQEHMVRLQRKPCEPNTQ